MDCRVGGTVRPVEWAPDHQIKNGHNVNFSLSLRIKAIVVTSMLQMHSTPTSFINPELINSYLWHNKNVLSLFIVLCALHIK
jgi:hypothetical protein